MRIFSNLFSKAQDFHTLSTSLKNEYLQNAVRKNTVVVSMAAVLSIVIECCMLTRLLLVHPALSTSASKTYFWFYISLIALSAVALVLQPIFRGKTKQLYRLQVAFVACYLLWNTLLNSYDLYRSGRGSSLALVMAIIFASILLQLRPQHIMLLQISTYTLFFIINHNRIEDKINATIAVSVAVVANLLFYHQEIQSIANRQRIEQMDAQLKKEQMDGAQQYLRRLQEAQDRTAIYHHDLRHTLNLVGQLARQGDVAKLQAYVSESQKTLESLSPVFFCEHETVNLILGSFSQRTAEKSIAFEAKVNLPNQLAIADTELSSLLYNLLENALHGAASVENETLRRISITAHINAGKFIVFVENGFSGDVRMKNDRPVPLDGAPNHGFGTQSIIDIAERHHGLYIFENKENLFRTKVLLHLEAEETT